MTDCYLREKIVSLQKLFTIHFSVYYYSLKKFAMEYIVTVSENKADVFLNFMKALDFVTISEKKEVKKETKTRVIKPLSPKEEELKKNLAQGIKELKAYREGEIEFQDLDDFLNEI